MDCFTPQQTIELVSRMGAKKAHMRIDKLFINSFVAGPLLGFGCAVLVSVNASPWYQDNAPGLIRLLGALIFPVGLVMIVLSGADLWTTNVMYMITSLLSRRIGIVPLVVSWVVSFLGNLAGSLFFVAIIMGYGGVFDESPAYTQEAIRFAMMKCVQPQWHQIFLRAIGANWLVCFAVYASIQSREVVSKIVAIWWPTACFVALALDHTIANMIFIPLGIWVGAPIGVGYYIWKSMIASVCGNIIGGGLFVGAMYWYLYLTGEAGVSVSFDMGTLQTAIEAGTGPLRHEGQRVANLPTANLPEKSENGQVIEGVSPSGTQTPPGHADGTSTTHHELGNLSEPRPGEALQGRPGTAPWLGGALVSGIAKDLGDDTAWAKKVVEREAQEKTARAGDHRV